MADCYEPCNTEIEICVSTLPSGPRGSVGKITQFIFYPAVGATDITGTDKSGTLLEVDPDGCLVALNGVMLEPTVDYSIASDGLTVTLSEAIVNANDVLTVQTWKTDEESSNAVLDLKLDVEKNTQDISGIDVRVTANEEGIQELQDLAGGVTTRNVKVSGVNTVRSVDQKLENQQDVNLYLDSNLADLQTKVSSLATDQGGTSQDLEVIREDIAGNAKGVSDNSEIIIDLTDKVSDNVDDITSLQSQVNKLPPPTDISELEKDVDDIALAVGGNTVSISKNAQDIAVLGSPPDLTDLNESVALNAAGISKNANDVKDIKAVDAGQSMSIADLQADVVELQATEFDTTGLAVIDADNQFTASQSIQDGVKITGEKAFLEMDKGTALTVSNGNFSNSVIDIMRSNGDIALSFEASGHIRGVKTDAADGSSAVSVDYLSANGGGSDNGADLSDYATKLALADEERARILGDQALAKDLQDAIDTEKYDDQEVRNLISKTDQDSKSSDASLSSSIEFEARYREEADDNLQDQIDNISVGGGDVNLDAYVSKVELAGFGYATEVYVNAVIADFATENFVNDAIGAIPEVSLEGYATEDFVTNAIAAIEFPEDVDLTPYDQRITKNTDDLTDLKQDVKIIEGEVGSIVSSKEEGQWKFNGASSSAAESGSFSKLPNNLLTEGGAFTFNTSDLSGEVHTFLEAEEGDDLELYVDEDNYGIFKIVSVSGEGSLRQIDTESLRGKGRLTNNDVARLKIFNISGIPANLDELDDRYVSLTGDTMTGNLIAKRLTARDATGTAVCLVEGRMENDTAASRITLSNKINGAAFGQISWHGQDENGWLEINKDVDFKEKELRGISSLQMTGALQAPRIDIKNTDDTAWLTVQGFTDQQIVPASGIALYNSEFDKEFGGIEWYYNGNYGALPWRDTSNRIHH